MKKSLFFSINKFFKETLTMAKKAPESKSAQAAKIAKSSSKEKKKWTSGKQKEEVSRLACVDKDLFNKIMKDVSNMKTITKTTLTEKYNIDLYNSIRILRFLHENEVISLIHSGNCLKIYCAAKFAPKEIVEDITVKTNDSELEAWG